jgi:DNA-binding transcriptional regulator YiaG
MSKKYQKKYISAKYQKTRRNYTYKKKQEILKKFDQSGENIAIFAKNINIPVRTLRDWNNNRKKIFNVKKSDLNIEKMGSGKKPIMNEDIEVKIVEWILDMRSYGIAITDALIIRRAEYLKNKMKLPISCKFSNGWLEKFKLRHHIVSRRAGSKIISKNDCDIEKINDFVKLVTGKINSKQYFSIINIDETGLYYDSPINFTLDIKGNKRVEIKATGREKQRVTIILGVDLLNNIKMKPFVIFKGTTKKCVEDIPLSVSYNISYQGNSWCTDDQFIKFLSSLPKDKRILLLYDNFKGHRTDKVNNFLKEKFPMIKVLLLPSKTTPILQPLDVGINKPFKSYIKNKYLDWLIESVDNKTLPKLEKNDRNKLLVEWISESWDNIKANQDIVKKSFHFCGYGIADNVEAKWKKYFKT